ncbi:MAG: ribonuclease R [Bacteroidetes bacterium CG23_combo_of_CG06-09_8_20_14_all_32_9]|nr:MAG: ribonuclease R [Bacteroidetes bacterium CG23_combo_of_CG06-09_8_20_14_all_32_9]
MSKKRADNKSGLNRKKVKGFVHGLFNNNPLRTYNYKQVCKQLEIEGDSEKQLVILALQDLAEFKVLDEVYPGKYKLTSPKGYITGTVELRGNGEGTIIADQISDEITVSQNNLNHALNGDIVKVYLYARSRQNTLEGEVVEIIKRSTNTFVGVIETSGSYAFLIPDGKNMPYDIFIPAKNLNSARQGQKAIVCIEEWPQRSKSPIGKVIEVLGYAGENNVEMHAILAEFNLPARFTNEVEKAAEQISTQIPAKEISARRDFRNVITFTIDPEDAKDFDDALSLKKLKNGNWETGIHIADVTYYITENSILEKEAYSRATSVYLVDRVVPMLPEKLSNQLCSLRQNEDKLCYSAVFEIDENAVLHNEWFGRTIINSNRRFNYDEAQQIIETRKGDFSTEILTLHNLAKKLRIKRFQKGAIDFDKVEVKFNLDENGKPLNVYFKENKDSNKLIEEFMLLANKRVAEFIGKKKDEKATKTFVYRIHDKPDPEKLRSFANYIKMFGYKINFGSNKAIASSLNKLLSELDGKSEKNMIENIAIRAMAKAEYSTHNIGHYGLGFSYYTHFTSPIRRYPDMMVHRLLHHYLAKGKSVNAEDYELKCKHSSEMEQISVNAERASTKYKQIEYMSDKIGVEFDGVISGVTEKGIYVEIVENKCEGMISLRNLDDDFYVFDEKNYLIYGKYHKKRYRLGDSVRIEVAKINLQKRFLDFKIVKP